MRGELGGVEDSRSWSTDEIKRCELVTGWKTDRDALKQMHRGKIESGRLGGGVKF